MIFSPHRTALALIAALSIGSRAFGQAPAQGDDPGALMEEARAARASGDHARALALASRAGEIRMTPALRLFIAEEQSELGEFAESMSNAEACSSEAAAAKGLADRENIVRSCRALVSKLQQSAARVLVSAPQAPPQIEVTVNGRALPESMLEQPYFVKPGSVRVEAKAPGHRPFQADTIIPPGEEQTITISLDRDFGPEEPLQASLPEKPMPRVIASSGGGSSVGPYLVLGASAVSFGASVLFLVLRNNAVNDLEKICSGPNHTVCPGTPEARSLRDSISRNNTLTNVALGVGGAAALGGALWLILDKTSSVGNKQARLEIAPKSGGAVVGVAGAF